MRAVGDPIGEASVLTGLAKYRIDEGDLSDAKALILRAKRLCEAARFRRGEAHVTSRLAELYRQTGRTAMSCQTLHEVLRTVREIGDRVGEAHALYRLGIVRRDEGRLDGAEATLSVARRLAERHGGRLLEGQARYAPGEIAMARPARSRGRPQATVGHRSRGAARLLEQLEARQLTTSRDSGSAPSGASRSG